MTWCASALHSIVISMRFLVLAAVLLFPAVTFAHAAGASVERLVGEYVLDIGYDPQYPNAGEPVRLDFSLYNKDKRTAVPFTSIFVRVEGSKGLLYAGSIHASEFGLTGFALYLPEPGSYTIQARFQDGDTTIVEGAIPLSVERGDVEPAQGTTYLVPIVVALLALTAGYFLGRRIH